MKRLMMSVFGAAIIALSLALPAVSLAEGEPIQFTPQIGIPDSDFSQGVGVDVGSYYTSSTGDKYLQTDLLPKYIQTFYKYFQAIVGILAVIVLMVGGVIWLTSAGDAGRVGQAKKMIAGAITGIVILFSSWLILNTINPNLVNLKMEDISVVQSKEIGCCEAGGQSAMITEQECSQYKGEFFASTDSFSYSAVSGRCEKFVYSCNVRYDCDGKVLWCLDSDTGTQLTERLNCGSFFNEDIRNMYEIKNSPCSSLSSCANKSVSCKGVADGEKCPDNANGDGTNGYCYDNLCYPGYGSEGERCGTEPKAFCSSTTCSQLGVGSTKYYRDTTNQGRSCGTLYCCYAGT